MHLNFLVDQLINGVTLGGMYALIALGYTLVYGIMLMINFAHSEMFMGGAFVGYFTLQFLTSEKLAAKLADSPVLGWLPAAQGFFNGGTLGLVLVMLIAFTVAALVVGILGVLVERLAYRPLRHAPRLAPLISAIGVSLFLQNAVRLWVSSDQLPFPSLFKIRPVFNIGTSSVTNLQLLIVIASLLILFGLDTFVSRTKIGKAMRATSQDRDAAGLMGIDNNYVIAVAFFIGPALGAVAGMFWGMSYGSLRFDMGFIPGMKSFTAAVIGGIGNLRGAMLGGFMLGIIEVLAAGFISTAYRDVIAFAILILVLVFRPGGLLGESVVEKV